MHLTELAYITEAEIEVDYNHSTRKFSARLKGSEIIEGENGGLLASVRGFGSSPEIAQRDYCKQIAGKRLHFGGLSGPSRDFNVPKTLNF